MYTRGSLNIFEALRGQWVTSNMLLKRYMSQNIKTPTQYTHIYTDDTDSVFMYVRTDRQTANVNTQTIGFCFICTTISGHSITELPQSSIHTVECMRGKGNKI